MAEVEPQVSLDDIRRSEKTEVPEKDWGGDIRRMRGLNTHTHTHTHTMHCKQLRLMMMSFICSCRNKK